MKAFNTIIKVLTALAAVAGAVYVIATYGDEIVAWAKRLLNNLPKCPCCCQDADVVIEPEEESIPEEPVEEAPVEEPAAEEEFEIVDIPVEPAPNAPVAEDADFAE